MALYEYFCKECEVSFEVRMPMAEVTQFSVCPTCDGRASKVLGNFSLVGRAEENLSDGPAPWESGSDEGTGDGEASGIPDLSAPHSHGHSHGPGGHAH